MRPPLWWRGGGLVEVASPILPGVLALAPHDIRVVRFRTPLTDRDHRRLGRWFAKHPDVTLDAYDDDALGPDGDLSFLRHYPGLTGLSINCTRTPGALRRSDLGLLPTTLRELDLTGAVRDLGPLAALHQLEHLKLRSVTADLSPLVGLTHLRALEIRLGGITDLSALPDIGAITHLELWLVRGLADLGFLADMRQLQRLHLQALRNVRSLPDLSRCTALEAVHLETMKGLVDLAPIATAPALRRLDLIACGHLRPEDLLPLKVCGALEELGVGMGSDRKNLAARALLGIPGSYGGHPLP